jgi:hypothetical protein
VVLVSVILLTMPPRCLSRCDPALKTASVRPGGSSVDFRRQAQIASADPWPCFVWILENPMGLECQTCRSLARSLFALIGADFLICFVVIDNHRNDLWAELRKVQRRKAWWSPRCVWVFPSS